MTPTTTQTAPQALAAQGHASREQLLALTPERYLAAGFREDGGAARADVTTLWAIAAAEQLTAAKATPAQLEQCADLVLRASRARVEASLLPRHLKDSLGPAPASPARRFTEACCAAVRAPEDVPVLHQHLEAVLRLLALQSVLKKP